MVDTLNNRLRVSVLSVPFLTVCVVTLFVRAFSKRSLSLSLSFDAAKRHQYSISTKTNNNNNNRVFLLSTIVVEKRVAFAVDIIASNHHHHRS